jgi:RNA polymerase sigma-70 factor (ECF subfamily)
MKKEEVHALVRSAKDGKQIAFTKLYSTFKNIVYNTIYGIVKNIDVAEDLVSETFTKAFMKINKFENEISFEMWLKTIATNTSIDFIRKSSLKRDNVSDFEDESAAINHSDMDNPENEFIRNESRRIMEENIDNLGSRAREVLTLRYKKGKSYKEIAEELGINIGTVKSYISKATNKIKPN